MSGGEHFRASTPPEVSTVEIKPVDEGGHVPLCGYPSCGAVAVFEGSNSDGSWTYYCRTHGLEEAERAGLDEVEL